MTSDGATTEQGRATAQQAHQLHRMRDGHGSQRPTPTPTPTPTPSPAGPGGHSGTRLGTPAGVDAAAPEMPPGATAVRSGHDEAADRRPHRFSSRLASLAFLLVLVPTAVAYMVADQQEEVFGARSELVFLGGSREVAQRAEQQLRTQTVLITSRAYLIPTAREFDVPVEDLEEKVRVEQLQDSEVLQLSVTADDPDRARRLVSSIVDTYVGNVGSVETTEQEQELLMSRVEELQARQAVVDDRLAVLSSERAARRAAGLPDPITSEQTRLESETRTLSQQIADLQSQVTELRIGDLEEEPAVRVVTPAYALDEPVAPNPERASAAGLLVGLLLAGGFVVVALRLRPER